MAIAAAAVVVPLGLLFFASGLIVNLFQVICYVLVRPLSKNLYRRINRVVAELLWLELVWLIDWWAGVKWLSPRVHLLLQGNRSVVQVHIMRHLMNELPETDEAVARWCRDIFVAKDALLDKHVAEDTFSDQELRDSRRPIKSLAAECSNPAKVAPAKPKNKEEQPEAINDKQQ